MFLNVFVDADNIPRPESLDERERLEAAFLCGGVKRVWISGNGCGKWAKNWDAFLSRFQGIEVSKIHVESKPQAADAALIAALYEIENKDCKILLLTHDALLRATFERICERRGWTMIERLPNEQSAAKSAGMSFQHTESEEEAAKSAVLAWAKKHPKTSIMPLNAIQSIAKNKKLSEAVLKRVATEVLGGLDKKPARPIVATPARSKQTEPVALQARAACAGGVLIECEDAMECYSRWPAPTCIVSDGPYGLGKFPGEPKTPSHLAEWYAPHVAAWSAHARTDTTLWFWCTEIGWALVHPVLEMHGWQYEECNIWDKGIAHVAGNCNSKTIRGMPVVTEVAVRYTRRNLLPGANGELLTIKDWVRYEWLRSGLPLSKANDACGVANAATRKYLSQGPLWYFPPPEAIVRMAEYCNKYGKPTTRPYFSIDGKTPITEAAWRQMRSKWTHVHGVTNVWREPAVHGIERIRTSVGYLHANQKPLALMQRQILACTDPGDVVWEPFGGLCSASIAAMQTGRQACAAEINPDYFQAAVARLREEFARMEEQRSFAGGSR